MQYIVVDGDMYLGLNKHNYMPVDDKSSAKRFSSKQNAMNIINSNIPKILRKNYNWDIIEDDSVEEDKPIEKVNCTYTPVDIDELKTSIDDLSNKFSTLQGNKEWLLDEQTNLDRQISDILHFIEFNKFSACEGYKLCKALKDISLQRRKVKNELELINIINTQTCNHIAKGNTSKVIDNLCNKKYAPRVLSELFESRKADDIFVSSNTETS